MQLRSIVPALGLIACPLTISSAQEIAKGVFLNGWVDSVFSSTVTENAATTNDFGTASDVQVGWDINERISATLNLRSDSEFNAFTPAEAYGSVKASERLTLSAGRSYGPFGYFANEPTGLLTVIPALTTRLYPINPSGTWAVYEVSEQITITGIIADGFANGDGVNTLGQPTGKPLSVDGHNDPNDVSYGLDIAYNPIERVGLHIQGYVDPSAGGDDAKGHAGSVLFVAVNSQYKDDQLTAGGEFIFRSVENYAQPGQPSNNIAWAVFLSHTLPVELCPMALTIQANEFHQDKSKLSANVAAEHDFRGQLALLTNPLNSAQFGLNCEVFYDSTDPKIKGVDAIDSFGAAIEGLFVIP